MINYISNGKVMIIIFIVELIKKICLYKMSYISEPYKIKINIIKTKLAELDLSNYATKSDLKCNRC